MDKEEEEVEEILIHWYASEGMKLTQNEVEDLEDFFDNVLNNENYFEDSDDWVMVLMVCQNLIPDYNKLFV